MNLSRFGRGRWARCRYATDPIVDVVSGSFPSRVPGVQRCSVTEDLHRSWGEAEKVKSSAFHSPAHPPRMPLPRLLVVPRVTAPGPAGTGWPSGHQPARCGLEAVAPARNRRSFVLRLDGRTCAVPRLGIQGPSTTAKAVPRTGRENGRLSHASIQV